MIVYSQARREIVDACLWLAERGFLAATGGNVSLRVDADLLAVTPSAVDYYSMSPEDICIVRLNTLEVVAGGLKPSIECGLHAALLRLRQDAAAVIHTHQPMASAVALLNLPLITATVADRQAIGDRIDIVPYAPSGTWMLVRALKRRLKREVHAYLLRNHGLICCGTTLEEALSRTEVVERVAAGFLHDVIEQAVAAGQGNDLLAYALEALDRARKSRVVPAAALADSSSLGGPEGSAGGISRGPENDSPPR